MISSDHNSPLDPASYDHQQSQQKSPEFHDTNSPLPSFSIRDYVFNSRNKNIARNWPFPDEALQICLKNGVKNLLPPFEPHKSLRNNSSNDEIVGGSKVNSNRELTLESINTTNGSKEDKESQEGSSQQKSKKSVLVSSLNLNTSVEQIEEVTHMTSKVCPVCKTYSSSSNTALNAHIDQCLFGESSMKRTASPKEIVKPSIKPRVKRRIKPKKKRLMPEIYKTAPHCTVEELDARNGRTSGGNNSSFPAQELEFQDEEEETEATNIVPEVAADHEGDVYIDNNGTKVRILSVPKANTSNDHGARKLLKRGKPSKFVTEKKKNKHSKPSPSNKKLCSRNPSKVKTVLEENDDTEERCKNDEVEEVTNRDGYPIVRPPWACSKRTILPKRANLRTPIPLTKPSSLDSRLVKRSTKASKGSKSSSSKKKLSLVSRDTPAKINYRKKNSALKISCALSLNKQNVAVGPSQDNSSKQVEEGTSVKTSFMSTNVLEDGKNGETTISIPENSVALERLNEDSTNIVNPSPCDVVSARKETRLENEQVNVVGSSMALNSSSNLELPNDKEMNSADLININADIDMQENNLREVNPIIVSKPPTIAYMVSEELQGNSSLASEEQHYYDMSDSPISTISNPVLARSDSDKFSVRSSTLLKDDTRGFSGAINDKYGPVISTSAFKNDHHCRCSRKEPAFSQPVASSYQESTLLKKRTFESLNFKPSLNNYPTSQPLPPLSETFDSSPPIKLVAYNECDSVGSPSKPVLRLMGKNLTVVNPDQNLNSGQFPHAQNEHKFHSLSHQPYYPIFKPSNNTFDTIHGSTTHADYFISPQVGPIIPQDRAHEDISPQVGPIILQDRAHEDRNKFDDKMVINEMNKHKTTSNSINDPIIIDDSPENAHTYAPSGYQSQSSVAFGNSGFQACSSFGLPFGKWYRTPTAGSSRPSAM